MRMKTAVLKLLYVASYSIWLIRSLIHNPELLCTTTKVCLIKYLSEVRFSLDIIIFFWLGDNGVVEGYYDFLSNKNIHVGISGCYKDICRKFIVTATSHYSLYFHYLRVRRSFSGSTTYLISRW